MVLSRQRSNFSGVIQRLAATLDEVLARALPVRVEKHRQDQTRLTPDQIAELVAEYQAGFSVREVAERWLVVRQTVSAHLRRAGVELRSPAVHDHVDEAVTLYEVGWSLARLGGRYDCDPETVRVVLMRLGVRMRKPRERT